MTPEGLTSRELLDIAEKKIKANDEQLLMIVSQYIEELRKRVNR